VSYGSGDKLYVVAVVATENQAVYQYTDAAPKKMELLVFTSKITSTEKQPGRIYLGLGTYV